jgi:hypothetical protein
MHKECNFTAIYRRGRVPSVEVDPLSARAQSDPEAIPGDSSPMTAAGRLQNPLPPGVQERDNSNLESVPQSMRNSPEPSQSDQQGHYVGPASGVSFLLRIQRKLAQQAPGSSGSSIFTFGDSPLPEFTQPFAILPPEAEAKAMVARYFEFTVPTHRFLHRPTIETWLEELYATNGAMRSQDDAPSRIALLFMVFAQATSFKNLSDVKGGAAQMAHAR